MRAPDRTRPSGLQDHGDGGLLGRGVEVVDLLGPLGRQRVVEVVDGGPDGVEALPGPRSGTRRSRTMSGPGSVACDRRARRSRLRQASVRSSTVPTSSASALVAEQPASRAVASVDRALAPLVGLEEARVTGECVAADARLLVDEAGPQVAEGDEGGVDALEQVVADVALAALQHELGAERAHEEQGDQAEDGGEPGAQRQPGAAGSARLSPPRGGLPAAADGIDTRHRATSSVIGPPLHRWTSASSASSRSVPVQARRRPRSAIRAVSRSMPNRSSPSGAGPPLDQAVGVEQQSRAPGRGPPRPASTRGSPSPRARARRPPRRRRPPEDPAPTGRRMPGQQQPARSPGRRATSSTATVANVSVSTSVRRNPSRWVSTRVWGSPARVSARHALRRRAPSAAASGPWPATSPMSTVTVPSGDSTVS